MNQSRERYDTLSHPSEPVSQLLRKGQSREVSPGMPIGYDSYDAGYAELAVIGVPTPTGHVDVAEREQAIRVFHRPDRGYIVCLPGQEPKVLDDIDNEYAVNMAHVPFQVGSSPGDKIAFGHQGVQLGDEPMSRYRPGAGGVFDCLDGDFVSGRQFSVEVTEGGALITDLSRNGTMVAAAEVAPQQPS